MWEKQSYTIPQITINRWYLWPFPVTGGLWHLLFPHDSWDLLGRKTALWTSDLPRITCRRSAGALPFSNAVALMLRTQADPCTAQRSKQSRHSQRKGWIARLKKGHGSRSCCLTSQGQTTSWNLLQCMAMYGYVGDCVGCTPLDLGCSLRELCSGVCFGIWWPRTAWSIFQHASLIASWQRCSIDCTLVQAICKHRSGVTPD